MREMISLPTCDHKVIAVTPAIELRWEGAEKRRPPAFSRPLDGWQGDMSLGQAVQLIQPSASIWRRWHFWGLCATASRQAACWHLPTAYCHTFPLFNNSFSLSKAWFQDEEALLNQRDQDVPWILKKRGGWGGHDDTESVCRRKGQNLVRVVLLTCQSRTCCWPHFPSEAQHHLQICR